jgi:hypothetical protein
MEARLILRERSEFTDGSFFEVVISRLAKPVPPCQHPFKYRLVWIKGGKRQVGFDNERGKGDHYHRLGIEYWYQFKSIEKLIDDFREEIEKCRTETSG